MCISIHQCLLFLLLLFRQFKNDKFMQKCKKSFFYGGNIENMMVTLIETFREFMHFKR